MIDIYVYKTIISFIALNSVLYITKDNWKKLKHKKNGFLKRMFNRLVWCLIPVVRWIWVAIALILGIALGSEEFHKKFAEALKDSDD